MILCAIDELQPGMMVGASVLHPARPELELIAPETVLTGGMIARLQSMRTGSVWITYDGTDDLNHAVSMNLTLGQREVYCRLRDDFARSAHRTMTVASLQSYRQAVLSLATEVISSRAYASLACRLYTGEHPLFSHCASVAYLALLTGLELESYIVSERPRLSQANARDLTSLGLAGMLHDIGKTGGAESIRRMHEVSDRKALENKAYSEHTLAGAEMLSENRVPASTRQAVLMHHQRWDGRGWPSRRDLGWGEGPTLSGRRVHVFARIIAAVNVVDNLLAGSAESREPAVAALSRFASEEFDGWFDPVIRRGVLRQVPAFPVGAMVRLSDGRGAVVTAPQRERPCRPVVRMLEPGKGGGKPETIDLMLHEDVSIVHAEGRDVSGWLYELPRMPERDEHAGDVCAGGDEGSGARAA